MRHSSVCLCILTSTFVNITISFFISCKVCPINKASPFTLIFNVVLDTEVSVLNPNEDLYFKYNTYICINSHFSQKPCERVQYNVMLFITISQIFKPRRFIPERFHMTIGKLSFHFCTKPLTKIAWIEFDKRFLVFQIEVEHNKSSILINRPMGP